MGDARAAAVHLSAQVCGFATFAWDLRQALLLAPGIEAVHVVAVDDGHSAHGPEVVATIAPHDPAAYRAAAPPGPWDA